MKQLHVIALAVMVLAVSCGPGATTAPTPRVSDGLVVTIEPDVSVGYFSPTSVEVRPGDTIRFSNLTPFPHNVHFDDDAFADSTLFGDGESYIVEVPAGTSAGTYSYVCTLHPGMNGRFVVQN